MTTIIAVTLAGIPNRRLSARPLGSYNHAPTSAPSHFAAVPIQAASSLSSSFSHEQNANEIYILKETPSNNIGLDSYNYGYELSDGSSREESAKVEIHGPEEATLRVTGSFSYKDAQDGKTYTVTYYADETGFHPSANHLPVPVKA